MKILKILVYLWLLAFVVYIFQNLETVNLKFINYNIELPLALITFITYGVGILSGVIFTLMIRKKRPKRS